MPWWIITYIAFFALIVLVNSLFWILFKQKVVLVIYHLSAGAYLVFITLAYWTPFLKANLSLINIPALLAVICVDFYFSVRKEKRVDIKQIIPDLDDECAQIARHFSVVEIAKAIPLLIASPSYAIGALLMLDVIKHTAY